MPEDSSHDQPFPPAPDIERRVGLPQWRAAGMIAILVIPVLAIAGVFGESSEQATLDGPNVSARVHFPTRFRYEMLNSISVDLTNRSARPIDTITVHVDSSYILRFSSVVFTPAAERAFAVPLIDVAPGETRLLLIEIQGARYGRHTGQLHVHSTSGDTLAIPLSTVVFP